MQKKSFKPLFLRAKMYSPEELARIAETGSNNISKASPEWKAILEQARREHESCSTECQYDIHHAYRLANESGAPWNKCSNCGSPYVVTSVGALCSPECYNEEVDALMREW